MDKSAVPTVGVPWLGIPWNRLDHMWNEENAIVISTVLVGMIPTNNCQLRALTYAKGRSLVFSG